MARKTSDRRDQDTASLAMYDARMASPLSKLERGELAPGGDPAAPAPREIQAAPIGQIPPGIAPTGAPSQNQTTQVNVTTNVGGPTIVFAPNTGGPSFIGRALWYLFIGWWLAAVIIVLGYVAIATIVGIPLAFAMFNRMPQALTLRQRTQRYQTQVVEGVNYLTAGHEEQRPWFARALYFLIVGWWFGAVWLSLAWLIGLLILPLPLSFWMYNRTGGVMTLHRH
jgi:uncharacterized membrane protein YccF (DUF307 family)